MLKRFDPGCPMSKLPIDKLIRIDTVLSALVVGPDTPPIIRWTKELVAHALAVESERSLVEKSLTPEFLARSIRDLNYRMWGDCSPWEDTDESVQRWERELAELLIVCIRANRLPEGKFNTDGEDEFRTDLAKKVEELESELKRAKGAAKYLGDMVQRQHKEAPLADDGNGCVCGICNTDHPSGHWLREYLAEPGSE